MSILKEIKNIAILGDGGWGTTLAILLVKKGFNIYLWSAFKENVARISKKRLNQKFLPGVALPNSINLTANLSQATKNADLIILAIPSQFIRKTLKLLKPLQLSKIPFLSVIKGIEIKSLKRISEVIYEELGHNIKLAILSGPTIAMEVAKGIPTTCVVGSKDKQYAELLQQIFKTDRFRVYTNYDLTGVELGGSLKNIIAIACGISDGLGFGTNTKAAILARGLAEISRLGIAMGAKKETFSGISGLGDLVTTCISPYSRNRFVGEQIGRGRKLKQILSSMEMIAEGVTTTKSVFLLSKKYNISMPITEQVYEVLYKYKKPLNAVNDLMRREMKREV